MLFRSSRGGIERAGCYGELWLRPLSQDLFSARVEPLIAKHVFCETIIMIIILYDLFMQTAWDQP